MLSKMNQIKMTFKIKEIEIVKFYKTEKGANGFESLIRKNFKLINCTKKDFNDFLQRGELLNSIKKHLPSSQIDILDIKKYILN